MKTKTINELTLKEYEKYLELIAEDKLDTYSVLELFGYDPLDMSAGDLNSAMIKITSTSLKPNKLKRYYKVGNWTLRANLNLTKISAAQFIDLQTYLQDYKLEQVLTVFLIPCKKKLYSYKELPYADRKHYLIDDLEKDLYNQFTIADANTLSTFFFAQSMSLLKVMKEFGEKKLMKAKMKNLKKESK